MFRRRKDEVADNGYYLSNQEVKRGTRARTIWALVTSSLLLLSLIFLILVEVGSTSVDSIRDKIYFIRLNVSNIIPLDVASNAVLVNSIARSLGLHDYYTVGLWGFCEGYNGVGFTDCSNPRALYWFNPVEILHDELLNGATITLPESLTRILNLVRVASRWMFGLFLTGACLTFIMIFLAPLSIYSRWLTLPTTIGTFLAALFTTVASILGTVLFIIMKHKVESQTELNIGASLGTQMFAYMWIAAVFAILAWIIQMGMCCCCASRRDVKTGRKRGSARNSNTPMLETNEK